MSRCRFSKERLREEQQEPTESRSKTNQNKEEDQVCSSHSYFCSRGMRVLVAGSCKSNHFGVCQIWFACRILRVLSMGMTSALPPTWSCAPYTACILGGQLVAGHVCVYDSGVLRGARGSLLVLGRASVAHVCPRRCERVWLCVRVTVPTWAFVVVHVLVDMAYMCTRVSVCLFGSSNFGTGNSSLR